MPLDYVEFAKVWKKEFPTLFDTKCMALAGDKIFGKTELQHLYYKCQNDKRLSNSIQFALDETKNGRFGHYSSISGQQHDAGYDAYMTGTVFACLAKYIEIGNVLSKEEPCKPIVELKELHEH